MASLAAGRQESERIYYCAVHRRSQNSPSERAACHARPRSPWVGLLQKAPRFPISKPAAMALRQVGFGRLVLHCRIISDHGPREQDIPRVGSGTGARSVRKKRLGASRVQLSERPADGKADNRAEADEDHERKRIVTAHDSADHSADQNSDDRRGFQVSAHRRILAAHKKPRHDRRGSLSIACRTLDSQRLIRTSGKQSKIGRAHV